MQDTETARLEALNALKVLDTAQEERFDRLTRIAARVFNTPIALVSLVDKDRQWFKSRHGIDACETPRSQAFCEYAVRNHDLVLVPDANKDDRFRHNPLVTGEPHIRFYAGAPLYSKCGEHVLGTLCVIDTVPRDDVEQHLDVLRELAATASHELASGRARDVMQEALMGLDEERALHRLVIENMPATLAVINPDFTYKLVNEAFSRFSDTPPKGGMAVEAVLGKDRFAIIKPYLDQTLSGETVHFEAASVDKDGEPVVYEVRYQPNFDSNGNVLSITALGTDVTRRRHLEASIAALAKMNLGAQGSLADTSREALGRVKELLKLDFAGILRKTPQGDYETVITHAPEGFTVGGMPVARHLMDSIITEGTPLAYQDVALEPWYEEVKPGKYPVRAFAGAPIIVGDEVVGGVGFASLKPRKDAFLDIEMEVVRLAGSIIAREFARKRADDKIARRERTLKKMATTDPLTNLANRREITRIGQQEVERSHRYGSAFSLAIMDIDHFKDINDAHGHAVGDSTLVDTADILKSGVRSVDAVGRFGGEEFVIVLPETKPDGALDAMEKVRRRIEAHTYAAGDQNIRVTASFGVVTYREGETLDAMLKRADALLYDAKRQGRNRVCSDVMISGMSPVLIRAEEHQMPSGSRSP